MSGENVFMRGKEVHVYVYQFIFYSMLGIFAGLLLLSSWYVWAIPAAAAFIAIDFWFERVYRRMIRVNWQEMDNA